MSKRIVCLYICGAIASAAIAQRDTQTTGGQQVYLSETDPASPRKSKLEGNDTSSTQVLRTDLDGDGDPDIIESWFHGKRVRFLDENDDATEHDIKGDIAADCMQVDRDGDGYYDGPDDMNIKWVDNDKDGKAEAQVFAINPNLKQKTVASNAAHYMVFEDIDKDGVNGFVDWDADYHFDCWHQPPGDDPNFSPDYNGNSIFLKEHLPVWGIQDPRLNWENPFAFYDFDNDGVTEMAIRYCDNKERIKDAKSDFGGWKYDGTIDDGYVTYDLDNDTGRRNEMDYDLTFRFSGGEKLNYTNHHVKHRGLKAPEWSLPFFRENAWRKIDEFVYVPHGKCYDELFKPKWGNVWLCFDEDDDDHRWERVELYYPERDGVSTDPYVMGKFARGGDKGTTGGIAGHVQSDTLGDRGEFDQDFSGGGKIYVGRWDGKIHLYGAEWGAWLVDYGAKFWGGAGPNKGNSNPEKADKLEEVVLYKDTDKNGYIDEITYDTNGDRTPEMVVNLNELGTGAGGKQADVAQLITPATEKWQGMHKMFQALADKSWQEAQTLYRAAWKAGLNTPELDDLAIAAGTNEKYEFAYWLKMKLFRTLDEKLASDVAAQKQLRAMFFLGNIDGVAKFIGQRSW
ncbi:MAG: hypothetical protein ACR2IE_04145 [Candidatus Sumerlaeaceae bacterium]